MFELFNPLEFHCERYKFEKLAIRKERLSSEKINTLDIYKNFSLSPSACITGYEKANSNVHGALKCLSKTAQRETRKKNAYKSAKCVVPCVASQFLHVTDKVLGFASKGDFSQNERKTCTTHFRPDRSWNWAPENVHFQLNNPDTRVEDQNCAQLHYRAQDARLRN